MNTCPNTHHFNGNKSLKNFKFIYNKNESSNHKDLSYTYTIGTKTFQKQYLVPFKTARKLKNNLGAEVAKETRVIPTKNLDVRIFKTKATNTITNNTPQKNAISNLALKQYLESLFFYIKVVLNTFRAITNLLFNIIRRIFQLTDSPT